jgi:hypothetical protein
MRQLVYFKLPESMLTLQSYKERPGKQYPLLYTCRCKESKIAISDAIAKQKEFLDHPMPSLRSMKNAGIIKRPISNRAVNDQIDPTIEEVGQEAESEI